MSQFRALGFGFVGPSVPPGEAETEYVIVQPPLLRVMAFRNRSIDDVVNSPIVKNEIYGYWKLYRSIQRHSEIVDLERQWNPLGIKP